MADPELVRVLDFILNRCDEASMDAVAAAVERRRRDLSMFARSGLGDPTAWAKQVAGGVGLGGGMGIDAVRNTVRNLVTDMLKREAPELTEAQVEELLVAWMPSASTRPAEASNLKPELISSMVDQFVAFSTGKMPAAEDKALRKELGAWPDRYWKAFPAVVRSVISDYLGERSSQAEFRSKLRSAIDLSCGKKAAT